MDTLLKLLIELLIGVFVIGVYGVIEIEKLKINIRYWLILIWVSGMGITILIKMIDFINKNAL